MSWIQLMSTIDVNLAKSLFIKVENSLKKVSGLT